MVIHTDHLINQRGNIIIFINWRIDMKKILLLAIIMSSSSAWAASWSLYGTDAINRTVKVATYYDYAQCENSKWQFSSLYKNLRCIQD